MGRIFGLCFPVTCLCSEMVLPCPGGNSKNGPLNHLALENGPFVTKKWAKKMGQRHAQLQLTITKRAVKPRQLMVTRPELVID